MNVARGVGIELLLLYVEEVHNGGIHAALCWKIVMPLNHTVKGTPSRARVRYWYSQYNIMGGTMACVAAMCISGHGVLMTPGTASLDPGEDCTSRASQYVWRRGPKEAYSERRGCLGSTTALSRSQPLLSV